MVHHKEGFQPNDACPGNMSVVLSICLHVRSSKFLGDTSAVSTEFCGQTGNSHSEGTLCSATLELCVLDKSHVLVDVESYKVRASIDDSRTLNIYRDIQQPMPMKGWSNVMEHLTS